MSEISEFLASLPYFSGLSPESVADLARETLERKYSPGELLFLEGEPCQGLYILKAGRIRIFKTSPEGKEQVLMIVGPGGTFNDVPVFDHGPNPATASVVEAAVVYVIPIDTVLGLLTSSPFSVSILKSFADRIRHLTALVEDLSFRHVVSRTAKMLLQYAVPDSGDVKGQYYTQQEMAAMVGTARDVVGRVLRNLERRGIIKIDGRRIVILDIKKLRDEI
ncbi:MAG: Crp/Fnr family transcriptional regulator [Dehalococcoidia bacterium]|nr:Crp/Fnr family transcriptional regulator [Dehalococcoidia bacterium]